MPADEIPCGPDEGARIDRDIRLNEAWHEADEMAREQVARDGLSGEEAERAVESWRELYGYDTSPETSENEILRAEGIDVPPADDLDDAELTAKLWEIIYALAARNTYLHHTDHLGDRELYTHLVEEAFNEITKDLVIPGWTQHIDIIGGGSEEDVQIGLRYYDDDESRARWHEHWPDDVIPPKEKPPYDRDRLLPKCEHG